MQNPPNTNPEIGSSESTQQIEPSVKSLNEKLIQFIQVPFSFKIYFQLLNIIIEKTFIRLHLIV